MSNLDKFHDIHSSYSTVIQLCLHDSWVKFLMHLPNKSAGRHSLCISDLTILCFVQQKATPHNVSYLFLVHIKWYHTNNAWKCKGYMSLLITWPNNRSISYGQVGLLAYKMFKQMFSGFKLHAVSK